MSEAARATTVAGWKKAKTHNVLLPSGVRVEMVIPDLPALIETGEFPQHLLDAAIGIATKGEVASKDDVVKQREFTDTLVQIAVVEPKLSPEDVKEIPFEDKEMIVALATRSRDLDAEGEHIAGLTKSEKFRRFRGLGSFDADVAGL